MVPGLLEAVTLLGSAGMSAYATIAATKAKAQQASFDRLVKTMELNAAATDKAREYNAIQEGAIKRNHKKKWVLFGHPFWERESTVDDQGHVIGHGFHMTRRIIALLIVFTAFISPSLLPVFFSQLTVAYGYSETVTGIFTADHTAIKWLILGDGERTLFIPPYVSLSVSSVLGLFFGNQIVK